MKKKPKVIIKTQRSGCTRLYVDGKWQRGVTEIGFYGISDFYGKKHIICKYQKYKLDKHGRHIINNNELVRVEKVVRI